jgi:hypothetical protein
MKLRWNSKLRAYMPYKQFMPISALGRIFAASLALFIAVPLLMGAITTIDLVNQTHGTLTETRGGTNQTSYTLGDILYASGANALAKLNGNTTSTNKFLCQTGNGSISAAPAWCALIAGDIPSLDAAKISTGTLATARLGSGTANSTSYLRGDQTWVVVPTALSQLSNQTPTGTIDGSNAAFTTSQTCTHLYLYKNGQRMVPGASADYTLSTTTITMSSGAKPLTGDVLTYDCQY